MRCMKRARIVPAVTVLLFVGCGWNVVDHIDALRVSRKRYVHGTLPSPQRMAELYPGQELGVFGSHRSRLREDEHARAILDAGEAAVPDLARLLDDRERRTLAAFFLAEIGGEPAATAVLGRWRDVRGGVETKSVYQVFERAGGPVTMSMGQRHEGIDQEFYGELLHALAYVGRPVSAAIAADTRAAMDEAEKLQAAGKDLLRREKKKEEPLGEVELRWEIEPVKTASEGLKILAMVGAPEAPALFTRALRSPVRSFRWTAVQNVLYIGQEAKQTLPALGELLDDPDWREDVFEPLAWILDRKGVPEPLTDEEQVELAQRYKQRLRELGHLR
jgi:hypothetical protein